MKTICTQAKLKQIFTNHSIRATCVTDLDFNKFESRDIMTVSGHKSENSLKNYTNQTSVKRKHEMSSALPASLIDQDITINTTDNVNTPSFDTDGFLYMSEAELQELCNIDPTSSGKQPPSGSQFWLFTSIEGNNCLMSLFYVMMLKLFLH